MDEKNQNEMKKGGISVETEHIFPVIKKWLYSEKDIFLREIVSNACDAVTKRKRLISLGQAPEAEEKFRIDVRLDKEEKTITVTDNGIGMTKEEIEKYLCQIALSGALDFIQKYEGESKDSGNGIIGHFGLGFYSAFMVSESVEVNSRSYSGAPAVKWVCNENGEYVISDSDREAVGTEVIMQISEDGEEFLSSYKLREILNKYCAFMPVEIFFTDTDEEKKKAEEKAKAAEKAEGSDKAGTDDGTDASKGAQDGGTSEEKPEEEKPINDTNPLWMKNPSSCTDEEYSEFYRKVFNDYKEPLFHIHINAEYPLNFKGILYFPKINHEYEGLEGQVKLYYNQVFVADNIKEVIPEYLLMLKGVIDCPELPLNVSRSYLQNSGYVAKISAHIVKKVADKLNSLFNTDRENYEKLWSDLKIFVEYGSLRDRKFYDKVKDSILFEQTDGTHKTLSEYLEKAKGKHENTIYYASDKVTQAQYISLFNAQGIDVLHLPHMLDGQFIAFVESCEADKKLKFVRIDADLADALKGDGEKLENEELKKLFKEVSGNDKLEVRFENLKDEKIPAILNISEESRRMSDMMKMYGMTDLPSQDEASLILNSNSALVKNLIGRIDSERDELVPVAKQIYSLALLGQRQLTADELKSFLDGSFELLEKRFCK